MKFIILSCLVACVFGDVSHLKKDEREAKIITQELDMSPEGGYQYAFDSDNGISVQGRGEVINANAENAYQIAQGQIKYTAPEGENIILTYTADENGYQPQGSHLPTPPPIPEAIVRALRYISEHPPPPEKN